MTEEPITRANRADELFDDEQLPAESARPHSAASTAYCSGTARRYSRRDNLTRTRRLIMAALRVWELKHGIRD
jgi:hypothetical protein